MWQPQGSTHCEPSTITTNSSDYMNNIAYNASNPQPYNNAVCVDNSTVRQELEGRLSALDSWLNDITVQCRILEQGTEMYRRTIGADCNQPGADCLKDDKKMHPVPIINIVDSLITRANDIYSHLLAINNAL